MRFRLVMILLVFLTACATAKMVGPGGATLKTHTDKTLRMQIPVPEGWTVQWRNEPVRSLHIQEESGDSRIVVYVNPQAISARQVYEEILKDRKYQDAAALQGIVDERPALGLRKTKHGMTATAFVIDHDNGVYVMVMLADDAADQELMDFIFARVRFTGSP
ncbi:MAG: hypothetical protein P9L99_15805 [Candidatus Lernaella stagnicola]|nr:hypothetical protein [Candidatus Lernaella stagnicola]